MNYKKDFYEHCKSGNLQGAQFAASHTEVEDIIDVCFLESTITGHTQITRYLVENFSIDIHQDNERALKNACSFQNYQTVTYLIEKGANIEVDNYSAFKSLVDNYKLYKAEERLKAPHQYIELYASLYEKIRDKLNNEEILDWSSRNAHADIVKDILSVVDIEDESVLGKLVTNSIESDSDLLKDLITNKNLSHKNKLDIILYGIEKHDNGKVYDLIDYNDNDFQLIIEKTLAHNNLEILKSLIDNKKIPNSIDVLKQCVTYEAYLLLEHEILHRPHDICLYFIESKENIAFEMLKKGFDIFEHQVNSIGHKDNYYFTPDSRLTSFYEPLELKGKESMSYLLLNTSDYELIEKVIRNRKVLSLQDNTIIQFVIEQKYDYSLTPLRVLASECVNLEMDTQGYLVQIAAFLEDETLIEILSKLGSNVKRFLERYKDSRNWLDKKGFYDLNKYDCNNDRSYDVYKKFDEINNINDSILKTCEIVSMLIHLSSNLEKSEHKNNVKI